MEGGKEERETPPPPRTTRRRAGPESARREARVGSTVPRAFPPLPGASRRRGRLRGPRVHAAGKNAQPCSLARARARFHGIRRSARTDRGTRVGRRRPSPISESTYCVPWLLSFAVSLCRLRETRNLALFSVPSLTRLLAPPPALSPCRFHVLAELQITILGGGWEKKGALHFRRKSRQFGPGAPGGGGGGSRACSLGLVSGSARRTRRGARRNDDGHEARGQWPGQEVSARIPVIPASLSRRAVGARQSSAESSRLRCCLSFSFALTSPSIILVSDFLSFFSRAGSREPTCSRSGGEAVVARWPTGRRPRSPSPRATS